MSEYLWYLRPIQIVTYNMAVLANICRLAADTAILLVPSLAATLRSIALPIVLPKAPRRASSVIRIILVYLFVIKFHLISVLCLRKLLD